MSASDKRVPWIGGQARKVRAVVQTGERQFEIQEFARPEIGPNDAILKVEACGICGSDISQYTGHQKYGDGYPNIPGHEPVGIIDEIGARAAQRWGVKVGDRVAVEPVVTCGQCEQCLAGERTACRNHFIYGFVSTNTAPAIWGGYSEYLYLHPDTVLHKISLSVSAPIAAMFNPLGAGVRWAIEAPSLRLGDTIVILGAGQRGLAAVIAARAAGARKIIVTGTARSAYKLDLALELGAHHAIVADEQNAIEQVSRLTNGRLADVVLDVCGAVQPTIDSIDMVRRGGTIVLAGIKGDNTATSLLTDKLTLRSITMRGVFAVTNSAFRQAIQLIESGAAPFAKLQTGRYKLADADAAIYRLAGWDGKPPAISIVIEPNA